MSKKTNGIGAFLRIFDKLYKELLKGNLKDKLEILNKSGFAQEYFSENSMFSSGSSDGASARLSLYIKHELGFKLTQKELKRYQDFKKLEK